MSGLSITDAEREFGRQFGDFQRATYRDWTLGGVNFVTPDRLGLIRNARGDVVEITTGVIGLGGDRTRVYGVTFNRHPDDRPDPRDGMAESLIEARQMAQVAL